jgi:hypothetical protein
LDVRHLLAVALAHNRIGIFESVKAFVDTGHFWPSVFYANVPYAFLDLCKAIAAIGIRGLVNGIDMANLLLQILEAIHASLQFVVDID